MLKCPICEQTLLAQAPRGWLCDCGEFIPFGLEIDSAENCASCTMLNCPRRKRSDSRRSSEVQDLRAATNLVSVITVFQSHVLLP